MANSKDLNPYESPQSFYGSELRRVREAARLSQERLGELVFCSGAYIGQIESAVRRPQLDLSQRMDAVLGSDGHLERLCRMVLKTTKHAEYFAHVAELQEMASAISEFSTHLVPGLLQTEGYADALFRVSQPLMPDKSVGGLVSTRLERSGLFSNLKRPQYWAILHESVLRLVVGGSAAMAAQLDHLTGMAHSRRILLQVIPQSAGAYPMAGGMVTLLTFEQAPPAVYVEGPYSGHLLDTPALVSRYEQAYDYARAAALPPEASLTLVETVAEEYRTP